MAIEVPDTVVRPLMVMPVLGSDRSGLRSTLTLTNHMTSCFTSLISVSTSVRQGDNRNVSL